MICDIDKCTGCGMCENICPNGAITMEKRLNDFPYPEINTELCAGCNLCKKMCPGNADKSADNHVKDVYAGWNREKNVRKNSTSGGVFTILARSILEEGGVVVGVRWTPDLHAEHCVVDNFDKLVCLLGSKYVQSDTNDIYKRVKCILEQGRKVLFSGTPCQNHAMKKFLRHDYDNLLQIDLVCHGVPSQAMLKRYLQEINVNKLDIKNIRLRFKDPYWDYSYVKIDYEDESYYQKLTLDDTYFNLFNIGFSLRESCHNCKYTSTHRYGDITLADYWGYLPSSLSMVDYHKGTSLILINTDKGDSLFDKVKPLLKFEKSRIEIAKRCNKCLSEPFRIDSKMKDKFWDDYNHGMKVSDLSNKYIPNKIILPNFLFLRRFKNKYKWVIKHGK